LPNITLNPYQLTAPALGPADEDAQHRQLSVVGSEIKGVGVTRFKLKSQICRSRLNALAKFPGKVLTRLRGYPVKRLSLNGHTPGVPENLPELFLVA